MTLSNRKRIGKVLLYNNIINSINETKKNTGSNIEDASKTIGYSSRQYYTFLKFIENNEHLVNQGNENIINVKPTQRKNKKDYIVELSTTQNKNNDTDETKDSESQSQIHTTTRKPRRLDVIKQKKHEIMKTLKNTKE